MSVNNNKRKLKDDNVNISPKKYKLDNDNDSDCDDDLQIDMDYNANKRDSSFIRPLDSDYFSVTHSSGRRCYVKTRDNDYNDIQIVKNSNQCASAEYYRLLDEIESKLASKRYQTTEENDKIFEICEESDVVLSSKDVLWVDKYCAKRYVDLLSHEAVNRGLLTWLKLWDNYVFKRPFTVSSVDDGDVYAVSEEDGRPMKKAVMLAGPPGIGKTTLAQILASHCGYTVQEMNASNERNPDQFYKKIDDLNSSIGWEYKEQKRKPSCLIIDEIDGTSSAAINVLINAMNTSCKDSKKSKQSKGSGRLCIRTPVICICNDPYAPSLKNLRPQCYLIRVGTPDYSQLLFRITDICEREAMKCDRSVLSHLIESSNRDIRSCLNTLQFLKQKGNKVVNLKDLESLNIGNKDVQKSIFSVWEEIFTSTTLKNSFDLSEGRNLNDSSQRCKNILKLTQSAGDLDRVISGIHENYLSLVRFKDVHLKEMIQSTDWMVFNDLTSQKISNLQLYELTKYKQYIVPYFHLSFASSTISNKKITWPTSDANSFFNKQKMFQIYETFMSNQTKINSWFHDKQEIIKVLLPSLTHIIRPHQIRPINIQLYSNAEKKILKNVVDIMISTGMNYVQERTGDLSFKYVLQPDIDMFVQFDLSESRSKPLTYACKQLIANEIKSETIRKFSSPIIASVKETAQNRMAEILEKERAMTTNITLSHSKKNKTAFKFKIDKKSIDGRLNGELNPITVLLNKTMMFRFKEGYTNAIRRVVKIKDL